MISSRILRWTMAGVCGVAFGAPLAVGQERTRPERARPTSRPALQAKNQKNQQNPGAMAQRLRQSVDQLDLTADQKTKVTAILDKAEAEFRTLQAEWQKTPPEPPQRMTQIRDLMDQARKDLMAELTDAQKSLLREKMQQGGATSRPAGAGQPLLGALRDAVQQLELSPEQKEQVRSLFQEQQNKIQELRQQAGNAGGDAREKIRELMQSAREKLQEILTPDQQQKLRELMQQQMGKQGPAGERRARGEVDGAGGAGGAGDAGDQAK